MISPDDLDIFLGRIADAITQLRLSIEFDSQPAVDYHSDLPMVKLSEEDINTIGKFFKRENT